MTILFRGGEVTSGEIASRFQHSWPTISRHLRVLEDAGLVTFEKDGRIRLYKLNLLKLERAKEWLGWFGSQTSPSKKNEKRKESMNSSPREQMTKSEKILREFAMGYPEVHEDFPWGHRALKVKKKVFVFMGAEEGVTSLSVKLPKSNKSALKLSFAEPTHYGMGKYGWVSLKFDSGDDLPMEQLKKWIDESYRAIAPKTLIKKLDGVEPKASPKKKKSKGSRIAP